MSWRGLPEFIGLHNIPKFFELIKVNGGYVNSLRKSFRNDTLKNGKLVGTDEHGNRYYENNYFYFGRNRWVEYADYVYLDYDASQISPRWYGWLHYKTDYLPHEDPGRPDYPWMLPHVENKTGTNEAYMPYSTTVPKIEAWTPPKRK